MLHGRKYREWMKRAGLGVLLAVLASGGAAYAAEGKGAWVDDYEAMRSIMDTPMMEEGKPKKPGEGAIQYVEGDPVAIPSTGDEMTVVKTEDAGVKTVSAPSPGSGTATIKNDDPNKAGTAATKDDDPQKAGTTVVDDKRLGAENKETVSVIIEDNQQQTGPSVEKVSLSETYYEEYEIFSESFADSYFFYTSAGNNSVTDKAVYVDIPAGLSYVLKKDGVEMGYQSRQKLSGTGTYVFKLSVVSNPEAPVSEQVVYEAVYNFRIQPKTKKAAEGADGTTEASAVGADGADFAQFYQDQAEAESLAGTDGEAPEGEAGTEAAQETGMEAAQEAGTDEAGTQEAGTKQAAPEGTEGSAEASVPVPACTVEEIQGGVRIIYDPEEVVKLVLSDGTQETEYQSISEITLPGSYDLYLYDAAGNVNKVSFQIKKGINMASAAFVLLLVALIAGGVVFFRKTRKNLNIQ